MNLSEKIMLLRKKQGWSQEELANRLNISRQSISKWESGQSQPDIDKIILLSQLFQVTTDYLLLDQENEEHRPIGIYLSLSQAQEYLTLRKQSSLKIAFATFLCVISPIPLIGLTTLSQYQRFHITENFAVSIGLSFLIICITIAVILFCLCAFKVKKYEFLEKEDFSLENDVKEYTLKEKEEYQASPINQEISEQKIVEKIKETPLKEMKKKIFVKAQIHGTYIVGEDGEGMYLIDQHAAQERINYEYFLEKYSHPDMTMRDLLVPITVEYPLSECMIIEERKELLKEVGIYLDPFGNGFIIKQLPMWMNQINEHLFIEDMIQQVLKDNKIDLLSLQEHAIATLSCKASLKGNSHLSIESMQTIVDNLMRCDNPYVCPHGRPTIIHYSAYDLEKLFKRVV